jgi:POT family proton-dependent oligopeptide transporter
MGINTGAFIGPLIAGWLALRFGWRVGFLAAAIGMPLGLLQFWLARERLGIAGATPHRNDGGAGLKRDWLRLAGATSLLVALMLMLIAGAIAVDPTPLARSAAYVLVGMAALYFIYLFTGAGLNPIERGRMVVVLVMFVACALFWSGFEQAGSSMNLFTQRHVDRWIGGFEIPAGWMQSVPPLFVITFAPVFAAFWVALARRNLNPAAPLKFAFGLLLMGLGFLFMVEAAEIVAGGRQSPIYWLVLTYLVHTFGELCLSPVGLSTVTKLAPARFVGQMMGVWFLASSLGKLTAGLIAGTFDADNVEAMPGQYLNIVIYGCSVGLLLLLISRPVSRLMAGVR